VTQKKHRFKYTILLFCLATVIAFAFYAPHYLTYSESPLRSDAIVLLLGKDFKARKKEAQRLLADGFSTHLIIPAYGQVLKPSNGGHLVLIQQIHSTPNSTKWKKKNTWPHRRYEDTHVEVLHAKSAMDSLGFKSANFVSSPYHMRRIKLIANSVFGGGDYSLSYVPTRYEEISENLWWFNEFDLKWVVGEYLKIAWFLMYEPFCKSNAL